MLKNLRIIKKNGKTVRTRNDDEVGAHTLNGWNKKSIGICLEGDFETKIPRKIQLDSLRKLLIKYDLPHLFHREADIRRTCPGFYLRTADVKPAPKELTEDELKRKAIQKQIYSLQALVEELLRTLKLRNK